MHFHHHAVDACTDGHPDWPEWALTILATLDRRELQLMAAIQADLDAATAALTALAAKVTDLESQIAAAAPALDSTALNAEVAAAEALLNPAPAPVVAAADVPAQPVDGVPSVPLA